MTKVSKDKAVEVLRDVPPDNCFWLFKGGTIHRLQDLPQLLQKMSPEIFLHHVNKEKNDFARWISDIIKDKDLAARIYKLKSKTAIARAVATRVNELKKAVSS